ncbi:uncharacterized protein LOC114541874 isoform X1 [Dendronephthya gigantea]|uniref:uncharacterized protein LOC114541874 isoform X1 n=1 Tax=Dendronephthya gigantea TaxID=151771 RepID=UPI00106BEA06|nr:uncharacterized protein LOC114541874 isoform X1 [Dendronephthya gigantea]
MDSVDLQEKANFTRLSRLLVDKGTEALRNTFDSIHPPVNLPGILAANKISLQRIKPRVINNPQWDLLFPPSGNPPDSKTFDVTLLTVLFRNICGFPSTGWGAMPPDTDRSTQANIARIKWLRNDVYAHVTTTRVDNAKFGSLWKKISKAITELGVSQSDVDDLRKCPLGPEEVLYVQKLKDWELREDECNKRLAEIEYSVNNVTRIAEENRDEINRIRQSHTNPEKKSRTESDKDLLQKLAKHNFMGKIQRKVKFFLPGTRVWLLKEVDEWFCNSVSDSRIKLIKAGPGFGKSVFAAKICKDFEKNGKLAACHFCDFSDSNLRDPMVMLQSLASQMCENVPGFKEKLLDQLKRPHQVQNLKDAFQIYLQNPLDELQIKEARLVVIDGLDESTADNKNEITHLIAEYFPDLPEYIKILVTSRPEIALARLRGVQKIDIGNKNENNVSDLEFYLRACLPSLEDNTIYRSGLFESSDGSLQELSDVSLDDLLLTKNPERVFGGTISLLSDVAEKCSGSFLYAYLFQSGLRDRYDLEKLTNNDVLEFLPEGLNSIYQGYFKRLEDEINKAIKNEKFNVLKILEMVAASKGPLPLTFIAQAFGLAPDCRETKNIISKINETVSCLLYVSDDMLTVFHKSVIDWLLAKGYKDHQYTVKVDNGHRSLWLLCEKVFEVIVKRVSSKLEVHFSNEVEYALGHGLGHLEKCEMEDGVFWSTDVIIVSFMLTTFDQIRADNLLLFWERILRSSVIKREEVCARISWHVVEFSIWPKGVAGDFKEHYSTPFPKLLSITSQSYLQAVLMHPSEGYFSDGEKKIAESLLSNVSPFVGLYYCKVSVLPRAVLRPSYISRSKEITVVILSDEKKRLAVGLKKNLPFMLNFVDLLIYSTKFQKISCCIFSPDRSLVLFGKLETAFNILEKREVPFFPGNEESFVSCAFSPNGKRLVTSEGSNTIKVWDVTKQRLVSSLCAEIPVDWCSFSITGLFIIGDSKSSLRSSQYVCDSMCVWNAITFRRSDKRKLSQEKCERCFRRGLKEQTSTQIETQVWWINKRKFAMLCPWICCGV